MGSITRSARGKRQKPLHGGTSRSGDTSLAQQDRRLTASLRLYWHSLKRGDHPPAFVGFNPAAIPTLWPHCLLAVRDEDAAPFCIVDFGPAIADEVDALRFGATLDAIPPDTLTGHAIACLEDASKSRLAAAREGRFLHRDGSTRLYRAIGLPFLDGNGALTYVVCAVSGRAI